MRESKHEVEKEKSKTNRLSPEREREREANERGCCEEEEKRRLIRVYSLVKRGAS